MANVHAEVAGKVWKVMVAVGDTVEAGDALIVVESMKMEIPVEAPRAGTVVALHAHEGDAIAEGALVAVLG